MLARLTDYQVAVLYLQTAGETAEPPRGGRETPSRMSFVAAMAADGVLPADAHAMFDRHLKEMSADASAGGRH